MGGEICLSERMLAANADGLEIDAVPAATSSSFREFLTLGVEHILTGYDHLVFLLGLLIAGGSLMAAAKIITSFTVAHSITLAVATLGWINISPRIVEPLIAVSIAYVGLENIFRRDLNRRWLLTFGFGLIHGFGFASVLREMGIGSAGWRSDFAALVVQSRSRAGAACDREPDPAVDLEPEAPHIFRGAVCAGVLDHDSLGGRLLAGAPHSLKVQHHEEIHKMLFSRVWFACLLWLMPRTGASDCGAG